MFVNVSTYNSIPLTKQRLDYVLISVLRAYSLTFDSRDTPLKWAFWTYVIKKQAFNRKRFDAMSGWRKNLVECGSEQTTIFAYLHGVETR